MDTANIEALRAEAVASRHDELGYVDLPFPLLKENYINIPAETITNSLVARREALCILALILSISQTHRELAQKEAPILEGYTTDNELN